MLYTHTLSMFKMTFNNVQLATPLASDKLKNGNITKNENTTYITSCSTLGHVICKGQYVCIWGDTMSRGRGIMCLVKGHHVDLQRHDFHTGTC